MLANFCFVGKKWSRSPRFHIFGRKKSKITRSYHLKKSTQPPKKWSFGRKNKSRRSFGEFWIRVPQPIGFFLSYFFYHILEFFEALIILVFIIFLTLRIFYHIFLYHILKFLKIFIIFYIIFFDHIFLSYMWKT